jgi:hypothetical protein
MMDKILKYSFLKTKASEELESEIQEELKIPDSDKSISSFLEKNNENTEEHEREGSSEDNKQDSD